MKHLKHTEFVDLLESASALSSDRLRHAETCADCQAQLHTLREMRTAALEDGDAEPSPLFWDHFSARVAEAIRNEPVPAGLAPWRRAPLITWATTASIVVLVIAITVWRTTLHAPAPAATIARQSPPPDAATAVSPTDDAADDADADEAWAVVRAAAIDLDWDEVHSAGISAHPGDVENVAMELSAEERLELARLLDENLKRNGA